MEKEVLSTGLEGGSLRWDSLPFPFPNSGGAQQHPPLLLLGENWGVGVQTQARAFSLVGPQNSFASGQAHLATKRTLKDGWTGKEGGGGAGQPFVANGKNVLIERVLQCEGATNRP